MFHEVIPLVSWMPQESLRSLKFSQQIRCSSRAASTFLHKTPSSSVHKVTKSLKSATSREEEILKNVSRLAPSVRRAEKEKTNSQQRTWKMIDAFVSSSRPSFCFSSRLICLSRQTHQQLFSGWSSIKHITQTHKHKPPKNNRSDVRRNLRTKTIFSLETKIN